MCPQLSKEQLDVFLEKVMEVERKYGNELQNVKSARKSEVRELIETVAAQGLKNDTEEDNVQ